MSNKEIPAIVRTIGDALKAHTLLTVTEGKAEASANIENLEELVTPFLPETLNIEQLKTAQGFMIDVASAQTLALGEKSQELLVENKAIERVTLRTRLGDSAIDTSYSRHKSGNANGSEWHRYGVGKTDVVIGVGRRAGGYKSVVGYLGEEAAKVFSN